MMEEHQTVTNVVSIYAVYVPEQIPEPSFSLFLERLSSERRERIARLRQQSDKYRSMLAELMVRAYICGTFKISNEDIRFGRTAYGKPILLYPEGLYFNVSHSGKWVVVIFHSNEVGIDIEQIKIIDSVGLAKFFSVVEYKHLLALSEPERLKCFYELWTLKESYVKALGTGLSVPLDSFSFKKSNNGYVLDETPFETCYHFKQYILEGSYVVSACVRDGIFPDQVQQVAVSTLLQSFT